MRLLVVEDHPKLARTLASGLREEGYAVDLTFDGREAARLVREHPYDAVVLDLMLPGLDGLSILRAMRTAGNATPVLCLTARDGLEDRVAGLDGGADDYLVKPFEWDELLARLRAVIRRASRQTTSLISVADLEIDTASKAVRRAGQAVHLSAREFALLELLAMRQGRVLSREEIAAHIYDQHDEAGSNVVDVYIGYLRNKIDRPFATKLIHTRRGHGYVLSADPLLDGA
jgi:two-component system copper resistance phosphate regulon response regulator CusR